MSTDLYKIDSHKLIYHPDRVAQWLNGNLIYPLYIEISPSGACNHRCIFCSVDFMKYKKIFMDTYILKQCINEISRLGVKSIMFAGEGEPLLHSELSSVIVYSQKKGVDVALTTNGVLLKPDLFDKISDSVEWIKISCNAGSPATYAKIHRSSANDFNKVLNNINYAAEIREKKGSKCTLGVQIVLLEQNSHEIETLADKVKDAGADYLVVKPYTFHPANKHRFDIEYDNFSYLDKLLQSYNSDSFSVIFRRDTMKIWDRKNRDYGSCLALPFWAYIDVTGNVWGCSNHLLNDDFNCGNIYKQKFKEIWQGRKRENLLDKVENNFDITECKINCRMDKINQYLWELKNPPAHVNFI